MQAEVFLDTAYAIALSSANDQFHARAIELADQLETFGTRLVTTSAVLLEIENALSKQRYRQAAVQLLDSLEADPKVRWSPYWSHSACAPGNSTVSVLIKSGDSQTVCLLSSYRTVV
jgi:predicted nucleic acid-binding protein